MPSQEIRVEQFYQIKITLKQIAPPIWRRLIISSETSLLHLHLIIQAAMDWSDSHLFAFKIKGDTYTYPLDSSGFGMPNEYDASQYTLAQLAPRTKSQFTYLYDFGDSWDHSILIEAIKPADATKVPICIKGVRACPPEDCGGVWGYASLMETLQDKGHPNYEDLIEWLGEEFDPEHFDLDETNANLSEVATLLTARLDDTPLPDEFLFMNPPPQDAGLALLNRENPFQAFQNLFDSMASHLEDTWISPYRAHLAVKICRHVANFVAERDLGYVMASGAVYEIKREQYSPAITFIAKSRLSELPATGSLTVNPDLAIEIEFPDSPEIGAETEENIKAYRKAKITTWRVLPHKKQIKVYLPDQRLKTLGIGDTLSGGDILPGFELAVAALFAE